MHRNGNITGYTIEYGTTMFDRTAAITGTSGGNRTFTATGLLPLTTYMLRIAAVNSNGTGPFSNPISVQSKLAINILIAKALIFFFSSADGDINQ